MLPRMCCVEHADEPRLDQALDNRTINRHRTQRCLPGLCRARRHSVKADKVRRAEQHYALYVVPRRSEPAIAGRGNRSGIDVTGMRRDQCLRYGGDRGDFDTAEELTDFSEELGSGSRVEQSGDGGGTDGGQGRASNKMLLLYRLKEEFSIV